MIKSDEIIAIGKFNKPHGINGEISASINAPVNMLHGGSCIVCDIDGIFVPFFVKELRNKSQDTLLLTIDDITNDQEASQLVNKDIYVKRNEYSGHIAEEEYLPIDFFINFKTIINEKHKGNIVDIDDSTANVLFVIEMNSGNSLLIPAVEEFIVSIDPENRIIEMDVPDELLEL